MSKRLLHAGINLGWLAGILAMEGLNPTPTPLWLKWAVTVPALGSILVNLALLLRSGRTRAGGRREGRTPGAGPGGPDRGGDTPGPDDPGIGRHVRR